MAVAALFDVDLPEHWCFLLIASLPFGFLIEGIFFLCFSEFFTRMSGHNEFRTMSSMRE